jgi:hypothetical protein
LLRSKEDGRNSGVVSSNSGPALSDSPPALRKVTDEEEAVSESECLSSFSWEKRRGEFNNKLITMTRKS